MQGGRRGEERVPQEGDARRLHSVPTGRVYDPSATRHTGTLQARVSLHPMSVPENLGSRSSLSARDTRSQCCQRPLAPARPAVPLYHPTPPSWDKVEGAMDTEALELVTRSPGHIFPAETVELSRFSLTLPHGSPARGLSRKPHRLTPRSSTPHFPTAVSVPPRQFSDGFTDNPYVNSGAVASISCPVTACSSYVSRSRLSVPRCSATVFISQGPHSLLRFLATRTIRRALGARLDGPPSVSGVPG